LLNVKLAVNTVTAGMWMAKGRVFNYPLSNTQIYSIALQAEYGE